MKDAYFVRESSRGYYVVQEPNGKLADSSCVDQPLPPAIFSASDANRIAADFTIDSGGFLSIWLAEPFVDDKN